jgi:hypothetical protein
VMTDEGSFRPRPQPRPRPSAAWCRSGLTTLIESGLNCTIPPCTHLHTCTPAPPGSFVIPSPFCYRASTGLVSVCMQTFQPTFPGLTIGSSPSRNCSCTKRHTLICTTIAITLILLSSSPTSCQSDQGTNSWSWRKRENINQPRSPTLQIMPSSADPEPHCNWRFQNHYLPAWVSPGRESPGRRELSQPLNTWRLRFPFACQMSDNLAQ